MHWGWLITVIVVLYAIYMAIKSGDNNDDNTPHSEHWIALQ